MSRDVFLPLMNYATVFAVAFLSSWLLTPVMRRVALDLGLVDLPSARRLHARPTPRAGGVALFIAFHLGCITIYALPWSSELAGNFTVTWWQTLLMGSGAILLVGLLDDRFGLRWYLKLGLQIAVISFVYAHGFQVEHILGLPLSPTTDYLVTLFWFLALVNAFNLIDGLDGLATGLATVAALGLAGAALLQRVPMDALLLVALVGACLGFLRYNFHPASIFLGDSGSLVLGFLLAAAALPGSHKGTTIAAVGVPLLAMGVPIFDTILAIWRRSVRRLGSPEGRGVMQADLEHLHHRLVKAGLTQRRVALTLYVLNAALVLVGLALLSFQSRALGIFLVAFVVGTYVVIRHLARVELWDTGHAIIRGLQRPSSPVMATILYPAVDSLLLGISLTVTLTLTAPFLVTSALKELWLHYAPVWCGVPFLGLIAAGTYSRVWSRARISEFVTIGAVLAGSATLALGITLITDSSNLQIEILRAFCHASASVALIIGLRCLPRGIEDFLGLTSGRGAGPGARRTLIAGTGLECLLFLKQLGMATQRGACDPRRVIGIVDEERNLRKRYVYGHQVLGGPSELAQIITTERIHEIVIAGRVSDTMASMLRSECAKSGITLTAWVAQETVIVGAKPSEPPVAANINR